MRGAYDAGVSYYRDNQVTMYGSTFQSLTDGNMGYPPAELRADGKVYAINTDKWIITANAIEAYNAGERVAALEETFQQTENPELVYAVTDASNRVLLGLTAEGRPYFPKNETYHVESNAEWLAAWLDMAGHVLFGLRRDGSAYVAKAGFLDRLSQIEQLLKDSGISGDDLAAQIKALQTDVAPLTETLSIISNEEWLHAVVDAEGKLLFGIKVENGEVVMPKQDTYKVVRNDEWLAAWLDAAGHVLFGIRQDGTFYAAKHEFSDGSDVGAEIAAINASLAQLGTELSALDIAELGGVSNHDTPNLLIPSEMQKTFNDGVNSFTPPNDGYEMSNRIDCRAGDWFTRTGTATGMVVVTDENDTNGERLFNSDGTTLGNTFQIPTDMTWVRYIRMAAEVGGAQDGSVVICKGKEAYTGEDVGDFITIDRLMIQAKNMPSDLLYIKSEDGSKYYQIYVDGEGQIKAKEIDLEVIPESDYPENWIPFSLTGDFSDYYDYQLIDNANFLIVLKSGGPVKIYVIPAGRSTTWGEFSHYLSQNVEDRFLASMKKPGSSQYGITLFDENFNIIEDNIGFCGELITRGIDFHDFIYIDDGHMIVYNYDASMEVDVPGVGVTPISGVVIQEIKKTGGEWKVVGKFKQTDYPELCTDAFGELGGVVNTHTNTLTLDYDGNLIYNDRNWDTFVKIRRVDNGDGTVTLGSATKDYGEAIIGRVGGRHNSAYITEKRVLNPGFSFTDVPEGLSDVSGDDWEEWQWYHAHDVKYWGMKNIDGVDYPTYTLFDNNYWTDQQTGNTNYNCTNKRNNSVINPQGSGNYYLISRDSYESYQQYTRSRVVQVSVDWENHLIKDYRVYILPKKYSREQSGVIMYDEGIIGIDYSYAGEFGLWDFTTEETKVGGHVYTGAKQLFLCKYDDYHMCYRANTYKKNV